MSPNKQTVPSTTRQHMFSFSSLFHSQSRRKASCIPQTGQDEPTCEEKIHYPVFNPQDPRHNPEISTLPYRRHEVQSSSIEPPTPISWVQTLSRRSYHRARSGLLALRAEFNNRFSEDANPDRRSVNPVAVGRGRDQPARRERQQHDEASMAHTASTQEDPNFGTDIFRMRGVPTYSTGNNETGSLYDIISKCSVSDSATPGSASERERKIRPRGDAVSNGIKSTYFITNARDLGFQFPGTGELEVNAQFGNRVAHITASTDHQMTKSLWSVAFSNSQESNMSQDELAESRLARGEPQATNFQHLNISPASSDLQIEEEFPSPVPLSRQCSADVRFAFPGIHQEMLDQYNRQRASPSPSESNPHPSGHCPSLSDHDKIPCNSCMALHDDMDDSPLCHGFEGGLPLVTPQTPFPHFEEIHPYYHPNPLYFMHSRCFGENSYPISEKPTTHWSSVEDYSSRWTTDNTTSQDIISTEMTSMASMSNDAWSPIDSDVILRSPAENGNVYHLVDGKTSGRPPDRENQAINLTPLAKSNGNIPIRAQDLAGLISPRSFDLNLGPDKTPAIRFDFLEEDTDDEFYPGIE